MAKMWAGRAAGQLDQTADDFNSSIHFDSRMYRQDITGSLAHAAMLAKQGIISEKDCEDILNGLASIADDLAAGLLEAVDLRDGRRDILGLRVAHGLDCDRVLPADLYISDRNHTGLLSC